LNKEKFRIAVATNGKKGLQDTVSKVFGRANTFTVVEIEGEEIHLLKVIENPALTYEHGAGPIAVKELVDSEVDLVIAPQLGVGASSILEHHNITLVLAEAGTEIIEAVRHALKEAHRK
jgi:predicted Fe-Mo cluster-binding NifX family protein